MAAPVLLLNPAGPWSSNRVTLDATITAASKQPWPKLIAHVPARNLDSDTTSSEADLDHLLPAWHHRLIAGGSAFRQETIDTLTQMEERLGMKSFHDYRTVGVHAFNFMTSTTVSAEIAATITSYMALLIWIDDLCFDKEESAACFGLAHFHPQDKQARAQVMKRWCDALGSLEPPLQELDDPLYPFMQATWETGRDMRRLSADHPDWFPAFLDSVHDYASSCLEMRADMGLANRELECFSRMRARNSGGLSTCVLLELANQCFLPPHARSHPCIHKLTWAAAVHIGLVNDIYSYNKEVVGTGDQFHDNFHLIPVLMREEGLSPEQALRRAVEVANFYSYAFITAEAELPVWETAAEESIVRRQVLALKEIVSGHMHYLANASERGYRWPSFDLP